jgi:hypothetical protein
MLGSRALVIPGIVLLTLGVTLEAGAMGAVKAIKMSAKLVGRQTPAPPTRSLRTGNRYGRLNDRNR